MLDLRTSGTGVCRAKFDGAPTSAIELGDGDADASLDPVGFKMCADVRAEEDVDPNVPWSLLF